MSTSLRRIVSALVFLVHAGSGIAQDNPQMDQLWGTTHTLKTDFSDARYNLFDQSNYGLFVVWGIYSELAGVWEEKTYYGVSEWIMNPRMANIPPEDYMLKARQFDPEHFNPRSIAQLAKDAGMKYIIVTAKYADGFAMFESEVDSFNIIKASPFGRDPMSELANACRELELGFGFYYSQYQDWTSPGGKSGPKRYPDGRQASFEDYFYKKCYPQVKEICSNYGHLDFIWFDTPVGMDKKYVVELVSMVRELQPDALLCSRVGHGLGDYASHGDMEVPLRNLEGMWETVDTHNDSWGYSWYDQNFKGPKQVLQRLISTVARGGTYLLCVGPDGDGLIPELSAEFLTRAGEWIGKYPQVIYKAGSSPWGHALPWGDVTTQKNILQLAVFEWPADGKIYVPGIHDGVESIQMLVGASKYNLEYHFKHGWLIIEVPVEAPDSPVSVIELRLEDESQQQLNESEFGIYPNIKNRLHIEFAEVSGASKEKISWMEKFGEWKHVMMASKWEEDGVAIWKVNVLKPGYYHVDLKYKGENRLVWRVETSEGELVQNQQAATEKYVDYGMGLIRFKEPGIHTVSVSLQDGDREISCLESIVFMPVY